MNWDAIGAVAEMLGAAAVLFTLLYLATQIKQTNDIARFSTVNSVMKSFDNLNQMVVSDAALRQALHKSTELSAEESDQIYTFVNMFCNTWVQCQSAYDLGLVDEQAYLTAKRDVIFEMGRWPNFERNARRWLEQYPEWKELQIFSPLTEKDQH